ncbi:alanine--tRNA ligase [candidate division KSB1 bacterium]|nr:MAG: alanine--tRNA ligase [candidate division KSB1 bacterium]
MTSKEIRKLFLEFFRERGHTIVPSGSVVPQDDPTLLFTNAGMNQFKPYFLGRQKPEHTRVADTQKCIRVSGKHNDLEEVGPSPYHHTFFEMLGNWSFGDYFKREAITWAWELMTRGYGLPKEKLYASVYETDDEAEKLWKSETDINPSHVLRFGKKDNFWSMGDTGPCGPCSELHIDRGPEFDSDPKAFVNTGSPRYIELWNLVFMQYDAQKDGTLLDLPAKHVDTGAGLERITTVMNGLRSNYDTDLFQPIIQAIAEMSGKRYTDDGEGIPHRVIADHLRCLSFAIADGAMPGNEGRGYVLRRILRRAARFGRKLDMHEPFFYKLVPVLVDVMGATFPEVKERHVHISRVLQAEEEHFGRTLDRGLERFAEVVAAVRTAKSTTVPGEEAFRLYDTFGFPLDLMQLMAREEGLSIDDAAFQAEMDKQKERARAAGAFKESEFARTLEYAGWKSMFVGYDHLDITSQIRFEGVSRDKQFEFVAKETPFYAEAGGQVSDVGTIEVLNNQQPLLSLEVISVRKVGEGILHAANIIGKATHSDLVNHEFGAHLVVSPSHRIPTQYNHTATHLLQAALREILGEHVHQAGSYVGPDLMRFDYTHYQKPTAEELAQIEKRVNDFIRMNLPVTPRTTTLKEAQAAGAMALFGEKYGEEVRLIEIGENENYISRELCGGTHTKRTGDMGLFVIKAETSVAAGVRRIESLTGERALEEFQRRREQVDELTQILVSEGSDPLEKLRKILDEKKKTDKELEQLRGQAAGSAMKDLAAQAITIGKSKLVAAEVTAQTMDQLKEMGDALRESLGSGVGVLAAAIDGKPSLVVVVTPDLVKAGVDAVPIVKELGKRLQGGGGGKPHMATAGGRNLEGIKDVLAESETVVIKYLQ